ITLDTGADSGLSNTDRITNDTTPLFIGTAEENSTVIIYNDKHNIVDTAVAIGGNWSVSIADDAALPDGKYSYTAKAIDAAGNVSDLSNVLTITIDTTAAVFFVDTLLTNDKTPQLTGSTDDWKAVIDIRVLTHPAQYLVDAIHNNANRTWVLADNLLSSIDEGSYDIEIAGVDLAGNVSSYHIPNALMLDLTAPNAPSTPDMSSDSDKGTSDSDNITTDPTPEFIGTAETGATVELFYDVSHSLGKVSVVDGVWHITSRKIPQGNHDITAITTDVAGNQSERSTALNIIIKAPSVQNSSQQDYYQFGVSGSQAHIRSIPSGIDCEYGAGDCKAMFYRGTKIKLELVNIQTPTGLTLADYNVIWSGDPDCEDQHIDMQNHINCLVRFYGKPDSSNKDNSNISENTPDSNVPNSNILEDTPDLNEPNSNISENSPDSNVRASNTSQLNFLNFSGNAVLNGGAEDMILGFILDGTGLSDVTLHAEKLEHGVLPQITLNEVLYDASLGFFYGNVLIQEQNTENFILNETLAAGSYTIQMSSTAVSGRGMTGISLQNNQLDLTNISVRGILDDPLILNFIVESQNSRNVTVRSHILQGQVETQMKIINLTTGQILAEHIPQTEDAIVEVSTGAYAVILDTLSGDGIGMIGVDLE
ncbi:Ig-like domain-containing protein, partial [Candidatus Albibeggiatoa sp. nov. BB20]|uniref:Ig-like domain-containing protein n=1 Tax=Candidatus Albibeggiatoa sp. nov. BB20 TaxID=3162723 RepID=UPI00336557E2